MTDLKHCGFYKHYTHNGKLIIESVNISDMQDILHALHRQVTAPDLTALDDQPQPDGWHYE